MKKFWTLYIIALFLPLAFGIGSADAVSYIGTSAPTSRPSVTMARVPTLTLGGAYSTTTTTQNAQAIYDCDHAMDQPVSASICISMYTSCLKGDSACGENMKLCGTKKAFLQNKIMCQDVLRRCPADAIAQLFGYTGTLNITPVTKMCDGDAVLIDRTFSPDLNTLTQSWTNDSRIGQLIADGKQFAAVNSVTTCKDVADRCIANACKSAPFKCIANQQSDVSELVNRANAQDTAKDTATANQTKIRVDIDMMKRFIANTAWDSSSVTKYIKDQCLETVGASDACFMSANGGTSPKDSDLADPFMREATFDNIMNTGIGPRWSANQSNIKEWMAAALVASLNACKTTMTNCISQSCGQGSMAQCYSLASNSAGAVDVRAATNQDAMGIVGACKPVAAADQNCVGLFASDVNDVDADEIWNTLWTSDATGAVAAYNAKLASSFNAQSLANLKLACQNDAEQCIRDQCGTDFQQCFTPSQVIDTVALASQTLGEFDITMATGVCVNQVRKQDNCRNHFDMEAAKAAARNDVSTSWGNVKNVGFGLLSANSVQNDNLTDDTSIFNELITGIKAEAEGIRAKEQNKRLQECVNKNKNSIQAYTWAQLTKSFSSDNLLSYPTKGLPKDSFEPTTSYKNGFCLITVTVFSDDADIQTVLNMQADNLTTWWAAGDDVCCGCRLNAAMFDEGVNALKDKKAKEAVKAKSNWYDGWLGAAVTTVGGAGLGAGITAILGATGNRTGIIKDVHTSDKNLNTICIGQIDGILGNSSYFTSNGNYFIGASSNKASDGTACFESQNSQSFDAGVTLKTQLTAYINLNNRKNELTELNKTASTDTVDTKKRTNNYLINSSIGAAAGLGTWAIVSSTNKNNIKNDAKAEVENTIQQKIKCRVGNEVVGNLGDIIATGF